MGEVSLKVIADQMFDDKSFGCLKGSVVCVSAWRYAAPVTDCAINGA